jgi:hypothetical protein
MVIYEGGVGSNIRVGLVFSLILLPTQLHPHILPNSGGEK